MKFHPKQTKDKWRVVNSAGICVANPDLKSIDRGGYNTKESAEEHCQVLNDYNHECYAGPDDPRLPADVMKMPVGKREDFVSTFNNNYYWYWKDDDEEYDEEQPLAVNAVGCALRRAYMSVSDEQQSKSSKDDDGKASTGSWAKESLTDPSIVRVKETYANSFPIDSIRESDSGGFSVDEAILIAVGWSLNKRYYSQEAVKDVVKLVGEKVVGYMNHGETYGRDPRDWSLVIEGASFKNNQAVGPLHIFEHPDGPMLRERIEYAKENDAGHLIGLSVDVWVKQTQGEAEGQKGVIVEEVLEVNSVDVVMVPAAGGRIVKTSKESVDNQEPNLNKEKEENVIMDLETLKKNHPDLVAAIVAESRRDQDSVITGLQGQLEETQAKVTAYEAKVKQTEDELKAKEAQEAFKVALTEELKVLPEEARTEKFVERLIELGPENMEQSKGLIADRKEMLEKISSGTHVSGQGVNNTESVKTEDSKETRRSIWKHA